MLGSSPLKQHIVEFILGVGVVTDRVIDASDTTGPFTWNVPSDVAEIILDGCAGGEGGAGGGSAALMISAGGGAGGGNGTSLVRQFVSVYPNSVLTVTVSSGGSGGDVNQGGGSSSATIIEGFLPGRCTWGADLGSVFMKGSNAYQGPNPEASTTDATKGGGGPEGDAGADGGSFNYQFNLMVGVYPITGNGGPGGGGNTIGDGGRGGEQMAGFDQPFNNLVDASPNPRWGLGTNSGGVSRGGGGSGLMSAFGLGGAGGTGAIGGDAPAYGAGGGGGAGGFAGGKGGDGYVRLTYWSAT